MKKILAGILSLLLILSLFAGCGKDKSATEESGSSAVASDTAQDQEVADQETAESAAPTASDISVTVPDGWESIDGAALAQYMKGTASFMVTCDTVPADVNGPDAFVEFAQTQFKSSFPDSEFSDPKTVTINGMDGRQMEFTASASGIEMKYRIIYILKGSNAFTLTCGDMSDDFDAVAADYESIVNSFKIL